MQSHPLRFIAPVGLLIIFTLLAKLTWQMKVGIDFTDEGYYLNWISNPWLYQYYVSQFGYIYHPIYQLLGSDFVLLRGFNALFTYALGLTLSYLIIQRLSTHQSKDFYLVASAGIALSSLLILMITGHWLPSPSYNSLCFQGLLITMIGMVLSNANHKHSELLAAFLIGMGGWLVFMAKPTSALLLCIVVPLYFALELKKYWRVLVGAGLVSLGLLLIAALYIDGSIMQFIKRYQMGLLLLDSMGSKHGIDNLLRLDLFKVSMVDQYKFLLISVLMTGLFLCIQRGSSKLKLIVITVLLITLTVMLWYAFSNNGIKINSPRYHPLILWAPLLAAMVCGVFCERINQPAKITGKLIFVLLILPYVYAAGSGNNYWETAAGAMLFWMLASLMILSRTTLNRTPITVLSIIVASLSVKVLLDAQNSPYRQTETIAHQASGLINPHTQKEIMLPKDTAIYLNDLSQLLKKSGFKKHTPVIDFTGHHPGTLYFMQANAIGQAWAIGGYDGSDAMATLALNQASCYEIANAWLLIEKDGRRRINYKILEQHGIRADKTQYQKMGMIKTKIFTDWGFRDQSHPDARYEQYFLKPINPKLQEFNCLGHRQKGLQPHL